MSQATSNWIIIVCAVIFCCVGLFGAYANIPLTKVDLDGSDTATQDIPEPPTFWENLTKPFTAPIQMFTSIFRDQITSWLKGIPVVGTASQSLSFIIGIATFDVPGMPEAITILFDILLFIFAVACARVIAGALGGGS